jgi:hypothetical protein
LRISTASRWAVVGERVSVVHPVLFLPVQKETWFDRIARAICRSRSDNPSGYFRQSA